MFKLTLFFSSFFFRKAQQNYFPLRYENWVVKYEKSTLLSFYPLTRSILICVQSHAFASRGSSQERITRKFSRH